MSLVMIKLYVFRSRHGQVVLGSILSPVWTIWSVRDAEGRLGSYHQQQLHHRSFQMAPFAYM